MASRRKKERRKVSAKETAEKQSGGFESTVLNMPNGVESFYVKKAGTKRLEVIPYEVGKGNPDAEEGDLYFMRTFYTHPQIGANNDMFVCPAQTLKKPCPICEARKRMDKNPDADPDMIKDLIPKKRQLWNIYDHDEPDKGVQVFNVSYHLFGKQLFAMIRDADDDDDYEFFADPEDGLTLKVGFEEKRFNGREFREAETIVFKPRRDELDDEILDAANNLDEMLIIKSYDELKAIYEGREEDGEDGEEKDADEPPKRSRRKTQKKKKEAPVDEPVDEPEVTADSLGIEVGSKVLHDELGACVVVKIAKDGTSLHIEDDEEDFHKVAIGDVELVKKKKSRKRKEAPEPEPESEPEEAPAKAAKQEKEESGDDDWDDDWDD